MPTVTVLHPNSTISIIGAVVVGAGDADDALRDHDDDDWVEFQDADTVVVALDDSPTIAADERISSLLVKVKGYTVGSGLTSFLADFIDATADTTGVSISRTQKLPKFTQIKGMEVLVDPDDAEWTETVVDGIRLRLRSTAFQTSQLRIIWANVEVKVHKKANTLQIAASRRSLAPLLQWSGIDNGDTQAAYETKIFTNAVFTGGGFDPETSTAVYESGVVPYAGTNAHQVPAGLLSYGTDYVWAAKAASVFPGGVTPGETWWGNWTFTEFRTTSLPVLSALGPTGFVGSSLPTIQFDYDDADLKVADSFQLKIVTAAALAAAGGDFDLAVATYTATFDGGPSGETYSHTVTNPLLNNTSYAYQIKAFTSTPFTTISEEDATFGTLWDPPGVPVVTALPDPDNARVRLQIQGRTNLLTHDEASFEAGVGGWGSLVNATLTSSLLQANHLTHSGELSSLAAGHASAALPSGVSGIPVIGGRRYSHYGRAKAGTVARTVEIVTVFYTAAGATISSVITQIPDTTSGWTTYSDSFTAPDNAAFASMEFYARSTGGASEKHYYDRLALMPGDTDVWVTGGHDATIRVERSEDGGLTWKVVRGAEALVGDAAQFTDMYDYEAPAHKTIQYRAIATSSTFGSPQSSDYSAIASVNMDMTKTFLKNPLDPSMNMHVVSEDTVLSRTHSRRRALYEPLGRRNPVIMTGSTKNEAYSILVMTRTQEEEDKLKELLESDQVLIHHTPRKLRYVHISGDITEGEYLWTDLHNDELLDRHWTIPLIEVDTP